MRIVSSVKSVSQDSKCSFMLPPWMLMELLCNCKRLKARTYIRADTLHLLYKFHGLSFYSMWVDFDLQVLYMSITGPRSHRLAILELHWRLPTDPGGVRLKSWVLIFSRICLGQFFWVTRRGGGNPHRPVILGSKDGTTILLQKTWCVALVLRGSRNLSKGEQFWFSLLVSYFGDSLIDYVSIC